MIRQATPEDEATVRGCAQAAYARYVPLIGRRPAPMDADYTSLIAAGHLYVLEDEAAKLAGFIAYVRQGDTVLLENVAVHPLAAGQGFGRALITHCEAAARTMGCQSVTLYTNAKMVENLRLYPRLGYLETERRQEDGFDRVYFRKPLG